ncbi:DUF4157 domain-containing protein [Streptomyces sp. NPDC008001]|uniref:eCIS core domain-containing protein n=1 Tax=Streptomyces sp. NPDC008001 TaxID=3364804 RepID=UPI0036F0C70B
MSSPASWWPASPARRPCGCAPGTRGCHHGGSSASASTAGCCAHAGPGTDLTRVRVHGDAPAAKPLAARGPAVRGTTGLQLLSGSPPSTRAVSPAAAARLVTVAPASSGRPLEAGIRSRMEYGFSHDFSSVRVHTGADAARSASALGALAYTWGRNVVFGAGRYRPGSRGGERIVAHELAHVLQQQPAAGHVGQTALQVVAAEGLEREADTAAAVVSAGGRARISGRVGTAVQCQTQDTEAAAETTGETDQELPVHDGDTPPGGPIRPVPDSPAELASPEAGLGPAGGPGASAATAATALDHRQSPVPGSLPRWISRIDISLTAQTLSYHWNDGAPGETGPISSGRGRPCTATDPCANQNSLNCTPEGTFHPAFLGGPGYTNTKGDAMSWYVDLGIDGRGIGIHNSQPVRGHPASHGCVRVLNKMAQTINENVIRRTDIVIKGKAATAPWRDRTCPAPPHRPSHRK